MTADSSANNNSPPSPPGIVTPGVQSSQNKLPWSRIVIGGGKPEAITAVPNIPSAPSLQPIGSSELPTIRSDNSGLKISPDESATAETRESSDSSNDNVGRAKKPVWNKPLNGVVEVGTVMGDAVFWPPLSESTRPSPKSSSDSSKPSCDRSISVSQGLIISHSHQEEANTNTNPKFTPNNTTPVSHSQRSTKRGGGIAGGSSQSGFKGPPPPPPPPPPLPSQYPVFGTPHGNLVRAIPDSPVREPPYQGNNWDARLMGGVGPQSHVSNYHFSQLSSSRRGNFGVRPRVDGLHHDGYGGRHDRNRYWNGTRGSNPRYAHMQHQMVPPTTRGFISSPPPGSTPFIPPQPGRPVGNHMGFDMASQFYYAPTMPPDSFRGVQFVPRTPPPSSFFPVVNPPLQTLLINQIHYYFSDDNLVKDNYLRLKMDNQGWVPITIIANFPRVKQLTSNIPLILDSLSTSTILEVQGGKVRRRYEWRKWIPATSRFPTDQGLKNPGQSTDNMLTTSFQKATLNDTVDAHTEVVPDGYSSEELTRVDGEDTAEEATGVNGEDTGEEACSRQI